MMYQPFIEEKRDKV